MTHVLDCRARTVDEMNADVSIWSGKNCGRNVFLHGKFVEDKM